MQSNKELSVDTRSLPQIFGCLSLDEQTELKTSLLISTGKTTATINNWVAGRVTPKDKPTRDVIVRSVNTSLKIRTVATTLLPV